MDAKTTWVVPWIRFGLVLQLVLLIRFTDAATHTIEQGATKAASTLQNYYGNDLMYRPIYITSFNRMWIMQRTRLPKGYLKKFYFYVWSFNANIDNDLSVQIWRPVPSPLNVNQESYVNLVWEYKLTVDLETTGALYTVNLASGEEFQTEDGDLIGWTNSGLLLPFACDYVSQNEVYYNPYYDTGPELQSTHSFGPARGHPINCSVGVEVVPSLTTLGPGIRITTRPTRPITTGFATTTPYRAGMPIPTGMTSTTKSTTTTTEPTTTTKTTTTTTKPTTTTTTPTTTTKTTTTTTKPTTTTTTPTTTTKTTTTTTKTTTTTTTPTTTTKTTTTTTKPTTTTTTPTTTTKPTTTTTTPTTTTKTTTTTTTPTTTTTKPTTTTKSTTTTTTTTTTTPMPSTTTTKPTTTTTKPTTTTTKPTSSTTKATSTTTTTISPGDQSPEATSVSTTTAGQGAVTDSNEFIKSSTTSNQEANPSSTSETGVAGETDESVSGRDLTVIIVSGVVVGGVIVVIIVIACACTCRARSRPKPVIIATPYGDLTMQGGKSNVYNYNPKNLQPPPNNGTISSIPAAPPPPPPVAIVPPVHLMASEGQVPGVHMRSGGAPNRTPNAAAANGGNGEFDESIYNSLHESDFDSDPDENAEDDVHGSYMSIDGVKPNNDYYNSAESENPGYEDYENVKFGTINRDTYEKPQESGRSTPTIPTVYGKSGRDVNDVEYGGIKPLYKPSPSAPMSSSVKRMKALLDQMENDFKPRKMNKYEDHPGANSFRRNLAEVSEDNYVNSTEVDNRKPWATSTLQPRAQRQDQPEQIPMSYRSLRHT